MQTLMMYIMSIIFILRVDEMNPTPHCFPGFSFYTLSPSMVHRVLRDEHPTYASNNS